MASIDEILDRASRELDAEARKKRRRRIMMLLAWYDESSGGGDVGGGETPPGEDPEATIDFSDPNATANPTFG